MGPNTSSTNRYSPAESKTLLRTMYADVPTTYSRCDVKTGRGQRTINAYQTVSGEITPEGMDTLFSHVDNMEGGHFVDLGSGSGKVVAYVALSQPVASSRGIEIVPERIEAAKMATSAWGNRFVHAAPVLFQKEDMTRISMRIPTHVYTCSTCFSDDTMNRMIRNVLRGAKVTNTTKYLFSQKQINVEQINVESNNKVKLYKTVEHVQVTWNPTNGVTYYIYEVNP